MRNFPRTVALLALLSLSLQAAPTPSTPVPAVLEPLKAKIGNTYSWKGVTLSFRAEAPMTEEQFKAIEGLGLRLISTGGKGVTNEALGRLAKLDPEGLVLDGAALTDDGFPNLAAMKSLRWLSVGHTLNAKEGFTGAGFAQLKSLSQLERLTYGGSGGREAAFNAIGELSQLKDFSSWHTQYGDPEHPYLLKLKNLETLRLGNSLKRYDGKPRQLCLTDASLATIVQVKSLKSLGLMQAKLSLPALLQLKDLAQLTALRLDDIDLSAGDYEKLRAALPKVKVTGKPLTDAERTKLEDFLK